MIIERFEDISSIRVFHFGDESQKRQFLKQALVPLCQETIQCPYFITRDWNGGPHYQIQVLCSKEEAQAILDQVTQGVQAGLDRLAHRFEASHIETQLSLYSKHAQTLGEMEKKDVAPIDPNLHGTVACFDLDPGYYKGLYNSFKHFAMHARARMRLQPVLNSLLLNYEDTANERYTMLLKIFQVLLHLFPHGEKFGALQYYSHSQGMLALARQYGVEEAFTKFFENLYDRIDGDQLDGQLQDHPLLMEARDAFTVFYHEAVNLCRQNGFQEEGFYDLRDQVAQMKRNVSGIDSPFHESMLQSGALEDVVTSEEHLVHRSLTNVLYNSLIFLNVDFKQKHFLCYAISRFISTKYDTTWQQILQERGFPMAC